MIIENDVYKKINELINESEKNIISENKKVELYLKFNDFFKWAYENNFILGAGENERNKNYIFVFLDEKYRDVFYQDSDQTHPLVTFDMVNLKFEFVYEIGIRLSPIKLSRVDKEPLIKMSGNGNRSFEDIEDNFKNIKKFLLNFRRLIDTYIMFKKSIEIEDL